MHGDPKRKTIYSQVNRLLLNDMEPTDTHATPARLLNSRELTSTGSGNLDELDRDRGSSLFEEPLRIARQGQTFAKQASDDEKRLRDSARETTNSNNNLIARANNTDSLKRDSQQAEILADPSNSVEEVYLYTCCGITKPIEPARKHMPLLMNLLLIFGVLVFLFGLANLGMGLWFRIDPKVYEIHDYVETQNFKLAGWTMLVAGFAADLLSVLLIGCCPSTNSVHLLMVYSLMMALLVISSISSIVLLTVYGLGAPLERFLTKEIYEQLRRRTTDTSLDMMVSNSPAQFLDFVQVKLRCCGALNFNDYPRLGMVIPTSCYTIAGNFVNAPGCGRALRHLFDIRAGMAIGFAAGSVIVQLASALISSLMVCSIYNWRASRKLSPAAAYSHRLAQK